MKPLHPAPKPVISSPEYCHAITRVYVYIYIYMYIYMNIYNIFGRGLLVIRGSGGVILVEDCYLPVVNNGSANLSYQLPKTKKLG